MRCVTNGHLATRPGQGVNVAALLLLTELGRRVGVVVAVEVSDASVTPSAVVSASAGDIP